MKRLYHLIFILNNLSAISIFVNILFLTSYSSLSIPIMIGVVLFYIAMFILYFKSKHHLNLYMLSLYSLFFIAYIIYIIKFQEINYRTYNMLYFSKLLLLPSIVYTLYNVFDKD